MLVDATRFPAPALWQGLMLIVISCWGIWVFTEVRDHVKFKRSFWVVVAIGLILVPVCQFLTGSF